MPPVINSTEYLQKVVAHPAILSGMQRGTISARVAQLTNQAITDIYSDQPYKLSELKTVLRQSPVANAALQLKCLRACSSLGKFSHPDKKIQKFIEEQFERMQGSLLDATKRHFYSAFGLGTGITEISWRTTNRGWELKSLQSVDPERVRFSGKSGEITHLLYRHTDERVLPYNKIIHTVNDPGFMFNHPFGFAETNRVVPLFRASQILKSEWIVGCRNQAQPILVGKASSQHTVRLLGADGKPILDSQGNEKIVSAGQSMLYAMQQLENSSLMVIDKENDLLPISLSGGSMEFSTALNFFERLILMCYSVPSLMMNEASSTWGQSSVSNNQLVLMDTAIESLMETFRDNLIERVVAPLLKVNFGIMDDYGSFQVETKPNPQDASLRVSNLISAVSSGILPATDSDVINQLRSLLGIPELDSETLQRMAETQAIQQEIQQELLAGQQTDNSGQLLEQSPQMT